MKKQFLVMFLMLFSVVLATQALNIDKSLFTQFVEANNAALADDAEWMAVNNRDNLSENEYLNRIIAANNASLADDTAWVVVNHKDFMSRFVEANNTALADDANMLSVDS